MNVFEWSAFILGMSLSVVSVGLCRWCYLMQNQITAMQNRREKFYKSLADPDKILADMEQGALAMEALQAKRSRNIRVDAGPHARIWKPRITGRRTIAKNESWTESGQ
jgi:hypothetical protein